MSTICYKQSQEIPIPTIVYQNEHVCSNKIRSFVSTWRIRDKFVATSRRYVDENEKNPSGYRYSQDGFLKNGDPRIRSGGIQSDTISVANPTFDGNKIGRRGAACRGPGADTIFALGRKASFPSVPSAEILRRVGHTRCPLAYYVDTTELEIAITTAGSVTFLPFSLVQPPRSSGFIPSICQLVYVFIFSSFLYHFSVHNGFRFATEG